MSIKETQNHKGEFNLSEKIEKIWIHEHKKFLRTYKDLILVEDVKEFIKRLKEGFKQRVETNIEIRDIDEGTLFAWEIDEIIDKLAGEDLK